MERKIIPEELTQSKYAKVTIWGICGLKSIICPNICGFTIKYSSTLCNVETAGVKSVPPPHSYFF